MGNTLLISDKENVVRLLSKMWVSQDTILHIAFTLRENETYISVNRPGVDSYAKDVKSFVEAHPDFSIDENSGFLGAVLNVGDIRASEITVEGIKLDVNVEVEPREKFTKSHAGIFTRQKGKNVKTGETLYIKSVEKGVSSDEVLLEVRNRLLDLARLEKSKLE